MVICTLSLEATQTPLVIVQLNTYTPGIIPVTVDVGLDDVVIVGVLGPLISAQFPVPIVGILPANVVDVTLHKL